MRYLPITFVTLLVSQIALATPATENLAASGAVIAAAHHLESLYARLDELAAAVISCSPSQAPNKISKRVACTLQTGILHTGIERVWESILVNEDSIHRVGLTSNMEVLHAWLEAILDLTSTVNDHTAYRLEIAKRQQNALLQLLQSVRDAADRTWAMVPEGASYPMEALLTNDAHQRWRLAQEGAQLAAEHLAHMQMQTAQQKAAADQMSQKVHAAHQRLRLLEEQCEQLEAQAHQVVALGRTAPIYPRVPQIQFLGGNSIPSAPAYSK